SWRTVEYRSAPVGPPLAANSVRTFVNSALSLGLGSMYHVPAPPAPASIRMRALVGVPAELAAYWSVEAPVDPPRSSPEVLPPEMFTLKLPTPLFGLLSKSTMTSCQVRIAASTTARSAAVKVSEAVPRFVQTMGAGTSRSSRLSTASRHERFGRCEVCLRFSH